MLSDSLRVLEPLGSETWTSFGEGNNQSTVPSEMKFEPFTSSSYRKLN